MYTNPYGVPGQGTLLENRHAEVTWGGNERQVLLKGAIVDGATRFGSSAVLSPGMLLGKLTASGKLTDFDPEATDGSQRIAGILTTDPTMIDPTGADVDANPRVALSAPLIASALLIGNEAMVGHDYEFVARKQLSELGCVFDDGVSGILSDAGTLLSSATTLAAAHYNQHLVIVGAQTITIPTAKAGVEFRISASGGATTLAGAVTGTVSAGDTVTLRAKVTAADTVAWFVEGVTS